MALTKVSRGLLSTGIVDNSTTTAITIDSSENVGIGTSSPSSQLEIDESGSGDATIKVGNAQNVYTTNVGKQGATAYGATAAGAAFLYTFNNDISIMSDGGTGSIKFTTGGNTQKMVLDSSGNVGIGTSSPVSKLDIASGDVTISNSTNAPFINFVDNTTRSQSLARIAMDQVSGTAGQLLFSTTTGGTLAERMRIDSSGNLLVGGTSASQVTKLALLNGSATTALLALECTHTTPYGAVQFVNGNGTAGSISVYSTSVTYNTSSDYRLKENIADADDAGSKVDSIQVRKFDWKVDGSHQDYGMIAQELQAVAPEAVSAPEDPNEMMGVDYSKLVPMLVKEIQSLRSRVAELENN